jgi:hypothetical protein
MTNRFCCCSESCTIFLDTFERATVGSNYDIISGSWNIKSYGLYTTNTDAKIQILKDHPDEQRHHILVVKVDVPFGSEGDKNKVRVYFGSSLFVELTITNWQMVGAAYIGECSAIEIYENGRLVASKSGFSIFRISINTIIFAVGFDEITNNFWVEVPVDSSTYQHQCNYFWDYWLNGPFESDIRSDCNTCLPFSKVLSYTTSAFSMQSFSRGAFSRGINENEIIKNPFAVGTGDTVDNYVRFVQIHYLRGYTSYHEQCPPACVHTESDTTGCVISRAPFVKDKLNITNNDFICGGFNIVSGTWNGSSTAVTYSYIGFDLFTSDDDALIEYTNEQVNGDIGAQRLSGCVTLPVGCSANIYIDYTDVSTNHCARFSRLATDSFKIELFKNGTLIETETITGASYAGNPVITDIFMYNVCTVHDIDGSGSDNIGASLAYVTDSTSRTWFYASQATTLNGGTQAAFGTDIINTEVRFTNYLPASSSHGGIYSGLGFLDNSGECETCRLKDCFPCPSGDLPSNGYSISVEGYLNKYAPVCFASCVDCPYLDGTYLVPEKSVNKCGGAVTHSICTKVDFFGTYEWTLKVDYSITQSNINLSFGWNPNVTLPLLYGTSRYYFVVTLDLVGPTSAGLGWSNTFRQMVYAVKELDINCDTISDEVIPVVSILNGFWWGCGQDTVPCTNLENLEIRVTGY